MNTPRGHALPVGRPKEWTVRYADGSWSGTVFASERQARLYYGDVLEIGDTIMSRRAEDGWMPSLL